MRYLAILKTHFARIGTYLSIINSYMIFIIFMNNYPHIFLKLGLFRFILPIILILSIMLFDYKFMFKNEMVYATENNKYFMKMFKQIDKIEKGMK